MRDMNYICVIILIYLHIASGKSISESCEDEDGVLVECTCVGNEVFTLPTNFNYKNLTMLSIMSCASADLHFYSLPKANSIRDIMIQNISGDLAFDAMLVTPKMDSFEIKNVGRIPLVSHDTFTSVGSIKLFKIENTRINKFDEQFTKINIQDFVLRNVIIDSMKGINFHGKAKSLKIVDTVIRNITDTVNGVMKLAEFGSIDIMNSTFEFQKPGDMTIQGTSVKITDCNFYNVIMNVVSKRSTIVNNCADGQSTLRIQSDVINVFGNRFPTQITYPESKPTSRVGNNTVCIAGNCKCPKSFERNSQDSFSSNIYLGVMIMFILYLNVHIHVV